MILNILAKYAHGLCLADAKLGIIYGPTKKTGVHSVHSLPGSALRDDGLCRVK